MGKATNFKFCTHFQDRPE